MPCLYTADLIVLASVRSPLMADPVGFATSLYTCYATDESTARPEATDTCSSASLSSPDRWRHTTARIEMRLYGRPWCPSSAGAAVVSRPAHGGRRVCARLLAARRGRSTRLALVLPTLRAGGTRVDKLFGCKVQVVLSFRERYSSR
jgi:hypothetical protein